MRVPRVPYRPIPEIDHGYRGDHWDWIVIHDEEGEDAEAWFHNPGAGGVGAHFQVKKGGASVQFADTTRLVWHAPPNTGGVGIECAGFASFNRSSWLTVARSKELREAARIAGYLLAKRHMFPRHYGSVPRRAGENVVGHFQLPQGGHHDPGPGFPWDKFMFWVRLYYRYYRAKIVAKAK